MTDAFARGSVFAHCKRKLSTGRRCVVQISILCVFCWGVGGGGACEHVQAKETRVLLDIEPHEEAGLKCSALVLHAVARIPVGCQDATENDGRVAQSKRAVGMAWHGCVAGTSIGGRVLSGGKGSTGC